MKGKINQKILQQLIKEDFNLDSEIEYKFHKERKWRIDLYIPELKLGIELEGGVWNGGRHTRSIGFLGDIEKYNSAALHGITIARFTHTNHSYKDIIDFIGEIVCKTK